MYICFCLQKSSGFHMLLHHQSICDYVKFPTMCSTPYFSMDERQYKKIHSNIVNTCMEIVGMNANDSSHSCNKHQVCGRIVKEGTVLHLALVSLVIDGEEHSGIEAVEVEGGLSSWVQTKASHKAVGAYNGAICRVKEVLSNHNPSPIKQQLHYENKGCVFPHIKSFRGNKNEEAGDDSDTNDTNNDGTEQDMPPTNLIIHSYHSA